jgi:hypothetical protein
VRDPQFANFSNNLKVYKGDELVIEGSHLNAASDQVGGLAKSRPVDPLSSILTFH